jgi:predicted flap endonuclease-1-like 5' DNA nuclease
MIFQPFLLHLHAGCLHLLLMASTLPLLIGLLLYWILRQRLQEKFRALEATNAENHGHWTRTETELAGLKYQNDTCVKELERTKAALRSCESENMALQGRLAKALKSGSAENSFEDIDYESKTALIGTPPASSASDDLKIIEGIGPKVEQLLKAAGIGNWDKLSAQTEDSLREILDNAGPAYQMMDPSTWPQQAKMASEGNWEELRVLQSALRGGRKVE